MGLTVPADGIQHVHWCLKRSLCDVRLCAHECLRVATAPAFMGMESLPTASVSSGFSSPSRNNNKAEASKEKKRAVKLMDLF